MIIINSKAYVLCLALILCCCLSATADYHYASHTGASEYPYTSWETAADSIQKAVDASSPHDTVYIGSGEWYQYLATEEHDSVAIIGMGIDSTFCFADSIPEHFNIFYIDYGCSVEDITFKNSPLGACLHAGVFAGVSIKNCRFLNSKRGIVASGYPTIIKNCIFDSLNVGIHQIVPDGVFWISNNLITNSIGFNPQAIRLTGPDSALIEKTIILNSRVGIECLGNNIVVNNNVVNALYNIYVNPYLKINNTVIGYGGFSRGINSVDDGDTLINNTVMNCRRGITTQGVGSAVYYNNTWNCLINIDGVPSDTIGNISVDPMLVSDNDFHLQAYSPLIDAGAPWILDVDGSRSDIGAYGGPGGETYIYLDLAPSIPDSIFAEFIADTIYIYWRFNTETDFSHYQLHRDTISGFEPSALNQVAEPETSYYIDPEIDREHIYYYVIASVDNQDNISEFSEELEVIPTGIRGQPGAILPQITGIQTNYPNPFNSSTTIIYWVADLGPIPAEITIVIYDITGRKVKTLVKERRDIGEHKAIWDGRDDSGNECVAGVYFARISQWGLEISGKPRKLVLLK